MRQEKILSPSDPGKRRVTDIRRKPATAAKSRRGKLLIKDLKKSFEGKVVYDGFNLELELGTFTSVFGPTGVVKAPDKYDFWTDATRWR